MVSCKYLPAFICSIFIWVSCSKSVENKQETPVKKSYISKRTFSDRGVFTYSYDNNFRMLSERFLSRDENRFKSYTVTFVSYDSQGRLEGLYYDFDAPAVADYLEVCVYDNAGRVAGKAKTTINADIIQSSTYDYSLPNQIFELVEDSTGRDIKRFEHKLSTDGKNIIETKRFQAQAGTPSYTIEYSNFDDKVSYMSAVPLGYQFFKNRNNAGASTFTPGIGAANTVVSSYTYNANKDVSSISFSSGFSVSLEYLPLQ
jgi:hypothetical protein